MVEEFFSTRWAGTSAMQGDIATIKTDVAAIPTGSTSIRTS